MEFKDLDFNKQNKNPVTDSSHQLSATEWNTLGNEVRSLSEGKIEVLDSWDAIEYEEVPSLI